MCSGPRKPSPPPSPPTTGVSVAMDGEFKKQASALLELSASDDLAGFRRAVEEEGHPIDAVSPWYGRSVGPPSAGRRMGFEQRTPLMIAAVYGSTAVLGYIISTRAVDVNRTCGSDGATALHCAASGGSPTSLDAVKMLIDASADVYAVDASGNRPADVIARQFSCSMIKALEVLLKASSFRVSSPRKEEEAKQGEKKEYPPDLTLPDIKNGIYGTDEFRMFTFKVKPCSRAYSHDWTECPFVHPGENARRRDPRKYIYSCVPCPEFRKGSCRNGDACEYAHGVFECWLHPTQYRTRLCKDETGCNRRVCFFAHKPEELRPVNPSGSSTGLMLPSPRSSIGVSSLDMAAAMMMMQSPTTPMSPSASSAMAAAVWMNQNGGVMTPTLQYPNSRLKSSLSSRDMELDLDLMGLDGYQQQLIDELSNSASPRSKWTTNALAAAAAATRASEYNDILGSLDPSVLSQLQGLSLKQSASGAQCQSPTGLQMHQNINHQLLSGYGGNLSSSPPVMAQSSFGLDHSLATAIMNSRSSAFAKRSQSFRDRGTIGRYSSLATPTPTTLGTPAPMMADWGSPNGKLDWGVQGEELNKLRKSASFGFRSNTSSYGGLASPALDEPDFTWVQSLVKDGPGPVGRHGLDQQQRQYQLNDGGEFHGSEMFPPWGEQMCMEQEQMAA